MTDPEILIVGAGPVGLTLAIDLGRRGVRVTILERNKTCRHLPKMERCNARTMEFYRRLGLADTIRAATRFQDVPMNVVIAASLAGPLVLRLPYPSVAEAREIIRSSNDGRQPLEPYQLVSQYTLEPLLKAAAERIENVSVRFGCEVLTVSQDDGAVRATFKSEAGDIETLEARFLVGCDGGSSLVRKSAGIELEGEGGIVQQRQIFFRAPDLFDRMPLGPARHYYLPHGVLVTQDDLVHFMVNTTQIESPDAETFIRDLLGPSIEFEILNVGFWWFQLLLAKRYRAGRVFLAGDSAHLVIPTGGLGMNTGIGDAIDLSWKLAAVSAGWGGPGLLEAYEIERRAIGSRNRDAARHAAEGHLRWRSACGPEIGSDTPAGAANRAQVAALADEGQRRSHEMTHIELGYRYAGSPLIWAERDDPPDPLYGAYEPSAAPGCRLPHAWLSNGDALHDRLGAGFTLLKLSRAAGDTHALSRAMEALGAPLEVLSLEEPALRALYGAELLLVRPDLHVAWRGAAPPADPLALAALVTGHAR